jgi:sulfide:quinone oxidoreductase
MLSSIARLSAKAAAATAIGTGIYVVSSYPLFPTERNEKVVIVGGGTAGIGVAAMLRNGGVKNVSVVEPSTVHYYQPLWTLVGGGLANAVNSKKDMKDVIPSGTTLIPKRVQSFSPESNKITLEDGSTVDYDYLVVAAGMKTDWNAIPGLVEGLERQDSGVVSVYHPEYCSKTFKTFTDIQSNLKNNNNNPAKFLFTFPPTTLKCAGAPQKIMWILDDTLRANHQRDAVNITFCTPGPSMFGVKHYSDKLEQLRLERGVNAAFHNQLVSIDVNKKIATFVDVKNNNKKIFQSYDMLHVGPHMGPHDFLKKSPLSDANGWVDVDRHTMQSTKYDNVFALGDCTNTPNSKTAAAVTSQAPVVVHNMGRVMEKQPLDGYYTGYASCPLVVGRNRVMLAEFMYGGALAETFSRETGKFPWKYVGTEGYVQERFFFFLKETVFPYVYWNLWTKGYWFGTNGPVKPDVIRRREEAEAVKVNS